MPPDKQFHVYMLANAPKGTLYIGVTSDLVKRVWQHKRGLRTGLPGNMASNPWFGLSPKAAQKPPLTAKSS